VALLDLWEIGPSEVISVVGAGGKSSLLEVLAREYETQGRVAVLTTTAKIRAPEKGGRPLVLAGSMEELREGLESVRHTHPGVCPVVGTRVLSNGKLDSLPSEWIGSLRDTPGVSGVIVEADGANRLPLKAPAPHEPVIPACSTLVVAVCGLDAQHVPLDAAHVHRPEILAKLLGLSLGERIPPELLPGALVLGYAEGLPCHARLLLYLNKADSAPPAPALVDVARRAPVDVWVGALRAKPRPIVEALRLFPRRPVVVVLAAGLSSRMRGHKLLADLAGRSVLGRAVATALSVPRFGPVVVVTGRETERTRGVLREQFGADSEGRHWRCVVNHRPECGMSSSLRLAAECAGPKDLLVLLGDQPFLRLKTIARLIDRLERCPRSAGVVVEREDGVWGPPALINRSILPLIAELRGDAGAREVLGRYVDDLEKVIADRVESLDIDRPEELEEARRYTAEFTDDA